MNAREQIVATVAAKREAARLKDERQSDGVIARFAHGRSLRRQTSWPGAGVPIAIAVLTQRERSEAMAAAIVELRARGIDDGKPAPEHVEPAAVEHIVQILARAVRDPASDQRIFASGQELSEAATEDEIAALFAEYSDFRQSVDPAMAEVSPAEWARFEQAVKKKEAVTWSVIASAWPRSWLLTTVDRLAISLISNSPSTSSDGESPTLDSQDGEPLTSNDA